MMTALTNLPATWTGIYHNCNSSSGGGGSEGGGNWTCNAYSDVLKTNWKIMPCVTERYYNNGNVFDVSDDEPGAGKWLNAHDGSRRHAGWDSSDTPLPLGDGTGVAGDPSENWTYNPNGVCDNIASGTEVMPLTSNKADLLDRIDELQGFGGTAGALGTTWAWYTLSPNWSSIWTGTSTPGPYAHLTTVGPSGAPLLRKVAVLMTDGGFNAFRNSKGEDQQMVSDYALDVCTAMKATGIEVYTVGFALDELAPAEAAIARSTLEACGTDVQHFYDTLNVVQLKTAFQAIGGKMMGLQLVW